MSRPTRGKTDLTGPADLFDLRIDPTSSREMALLYRPILKGNATDEDLKFIGTFTATMIQNAPPEVLAELFREILALKVEASRPIEERHRNWHALRGFLDFKSANGFKPTKPKLKSFLLDHKYNNMPDAEDAKGWARIWKSIGFDWLE